VNVRYFAAARAAAGVDEERYDLADGDTLASLLEAILAVERPEPPAGTPPLARILSRSSFLLNEVAVRDHAASLKPAELHVAKESLDKAESAFSADGASARTADLAYIAVRKAELGDRRDRILPAHEAQLAHDPQAG